MTSGPNETPGSVSLPRIGTIHSCFTDRFGIPRQPGLAPHATAELILESPFDNPKMLTGLEICSHVWIQFLFHCTGARGWHPTVRPPRLGGNRRIGVFASRSPFRPAPIGLSVVRLEGLLTGPDRVGLLLRDHDLADGTPVLDIKPYLPWSDSLPEARPPAGFEEPPPAPLDVVFAVEVEAMCAQAASQGMPLRGLIEDVLRQDPRPAYRQSQEGRVHGTRLHGFDVRWQVRDGCAEVIEIVAQEPRCSR